MVGSEKDDDDGDEFERVLGRSLDARAAEASQPGWEPVGEEVTDPGGGATGGGHGGHVRGQTAAAGPPMDRGHGPPPGGGRRSGQGFLSAPTGGTGRTPQERKRTSRGFNFDCDEDGPGLASCKRPGAGLAPPGRGAGARREPAGAWSAAATDAQDVQPAAGGCEEVAVGGLRRGGLRGEHRSGAGGPGAGKPHGRMGALLDAAGLGSGGTGGARAATVTADASSEPVGASGAACTGGFVTSRVT